MNTTNNQTQTYPSLDYWLNQLGSYLLSDYLYMYLITGLSLIAFGFNLVSWLVLQKSIIPSTGFYRFMKVYTLNGMVLSLILSSTFVTTSTRLFSFAISYEATFYSVYIYTPLLSAFYLNSSLLEIYLVIERMLYFLPERFKRFRIVRFKKFCMSLFIISVLIILPNYFIYFPGHFDVPLDKSTVYRIHSISLTPFSETTAGKALAFLMYFIRDILTMIAKLVLNTILVIHVRRYLFKLKMDKLNFALKISTSALHIQNIDLSKQSYINKTDRNQTYIALIMSLYSLFEHAFYIPSYILFALRINTIAPLFYFLCIVSLGLKHATNFLIFYKFNFLFRTEVKKTFFKILKRKKHVITGIDEDSRVINNNNINIVSVSNLL